MSKSNAENDNVFLIDTLQTIARFTSDPLDLLTEADVLAVIGETANDALADVTGGDTNVVRAAGNLLMRFSHDRSTAAGWWNDPETGADLKDSPAFPFIVASKLMLIVSEIAEAMEGHRKGLNDDKLTHRPMIEVELADAVLRIGDLAGKLGLDLGGAIAEKAAFNLTRQDHQPGARMAAGGKAY